MDRFEENLVRGLRARSLPARHLAPKIALAGVLGLGNLFAGCAAAPPRELVDARASFREAVKIDTGSVAPNDLQNARDALGRAEKSFTSEGDTAKTKSLAYVAEREAELAVVRANTVVAATARAQAERELVEASASYAAHRDAEELARKSPARPIDRLGANGEVHLRDALDSLGIFASIAEEPRGTVVTVTDDALFHPEQSILLGGGRQKLDRVAEALLVDPSASITIEGHLDDERGDDATNQLALDRANAVRDYLISHGVPAERVRAEGKGATEPIADNATPEHRAKNRRIEIVVVAENRYSMK